MTSTPARAATPTVNISASIGFVTVDVGGGRCSWENFLVFPDTPGVVSYSASVDDAWVGHETFHGPPFDDGNTGYAPPAPAGIHRFGLTAGAGPAPCTSEAFRFTNIQVIGTLGTATISGTVDDNSGHSLSGVTMTAQPSAGGSSLTATTGADGTYVLTAPVDTYVVTPSRGTDTFQPTSQTVDLSAGDATADFVDEAGVGAITGTVEDRAGKPVSGVVLDVLDGTGTTVATGTTDSAGQYTTQQIPAGSYTVTPASDANHFSPSSQAVTVVSGDVTADFTRDSVTVDVVSSFDDPLWLDFPLADVSAVGAPKFSWTIDGSGFTGATSVGFYDASSGRRVFHLSPNDFTVSADGKQIVTSPLAGSAIRSILHSDLGDRARYSFDVRVTAGGLTSLANPNDRFTFVAPTVTSATPQHVSLTGPGKAYTIHGEAFEGATAIGFYAGNTRVFHLAAGQFTVNNAGTQIVTLPVDNRTILADLRQALGQHPSYTLTVRVTTGPITGNGTHNTITYAS